MTKHALKRMVWTAVLMVILPAGLTAYSDGPPNRRTWCGNQGSDPVCGGGNCGACTACHTTFGTPNSGAGSVEIVNAPSTYEPGSQYSLAVFLDDSTNGSFLIGGFELSALTMDSLCQAGELAVDTGGTMVEMEASTSTQWLKHSRPQTASGGTAMWQFLWTAPASDVGDVALNVCANAANDADGNDGDKIYCAELVIPAGSAPLPEPEIRLTRNAAGLDIDWTGTAPGFNIYRGLLENVSSAVATGAYQQVGCGLPAPAGADPDPQFHTGQNFFYLVVASGGTAEGTYGCSDPEGSGICGQERRPAQTPCP